MSRLSSSDVEMIRFSGSQGDFGIRSGASQEFDSLARKYVSVAHVSNASDFVKENVDLSEIDRDAVDEIKRWMDHSFGRISEGTKMIFMICTLDTLDNDELLALIKRLTDYGLFGCFDCIKKRIEKMAKSEEEPLFDLYIKLFESRKVLEDGDVSKALGLQKEVCELSDELDFKVSENQDRLIELQVLDRLKFVFEVDPQIAVTKLMVIYQSPDTDNILRFYTALKLADVFLDLYGKDSAMSYLDQAESILMGNSTLMDACRKALRRAKKKFESV